MINKSQNEFAVIYAINLMSEGFALKNIISYMHIWSIVYRLLGFWNWLYITYVMKTHKMTFPILKLWCYSCSLIELKMTCQKSCLLSFTPYFLAHATTSLEWRDEWARLASRREMNDLLAIFRGILLSRNDVSGTKICRFWNTSTLFRSKTV
jgi:hypothetical protein